MASIDDLLSQIPISQIAEKLGVDEATATAAVKSAIPTLVGGLEANAQDPNGAASLESALQQHADPSFLAGGVDLEKVDPAEGQKIVHNVFGDKTNQVISALGGVGGVGGAGGSNLVGKLLPILAPIVLAFVAKQFTGGGNTQAAAQGQSGGGLGDVLGGLLGGGGQSGGGMGKVLGSLLGGGQSGGGLGDLLGGLLGGGRK